MNIVERVHQHYDSLTSAEQEAATFILGHLTDVLIYNSAELSRLSDVSQPTLSRLYRKLGYANASQFKRDVRRYHQPGAPETAVPDTTSTDLVHDQLARDITSLTRTYDGISTDVINAIADQVLDAEHIVLIGLRNNYPMALHLREQLIQSRPNVHVAPQPGQSITEEIVDLGSKDLVILFGARRRTAQFSNIVSSLHRAHVPMIMIGDSTLRRTANANAATFLEADLNMHVLSSFTTVFSLVALIADTVATRAQRRTSKTSTPHNGRVERINQRFGELNELE